MIVNTSQPQQIILLMLISVVYSTNSYRNVADDLIYSLNKLLDFVLDNYKAMNTDGILGINKAQAHLKDVLPVTNNRTKSKILQLMNKAETIYFFQNPNLDNYPFKYYIFKKHLLPPQQWKNTRGFLRVRLPTYVESEVKEYNVTKFVTYVLNNNFQENFFDECLVELIIAGEEFNNCSISRACFQNFIKLPQQFGNQYSGYRVTHMLLYLQIARIKKCMEDTQELQNVIEKECSYILWEVKKNMQYNFAPKLLDLFLEQIDLCGYEGYQEFMQKPFLDYILKSQTVHGCFKSHSAVTNATKEKRESTMMRHGCNSHTTGIASSVLALFLKFICYANGVNYLFASNNANEEI